MTLYGAAAPWGAICWGAAWGGGGGCWGAAWGGGGCWGGIIGIGYPWAIQVTAWYDIYYVYDRNLKLQFNYAAFLPLCYNVIHFEYSF